MVTNHNRRTPSDLPPGLTAEEVKRTTLRPGDSVRLKFLYPNAGVEILDCVWICLACLGADGENPQYNWGVVKKEGDILWKSLAYLVQIEIMMPNDEARRGPEGRGPRPMETAYHS